MMIRKTPLLLLLALPVAAVLAIAQFSELDPRRFASDIEAFAAWDEKNTFPEDPILFVGSSSIRYWDTATVFPEYPIINRGFGGSQIADVNYYFEDIVESYRPETIVFYAGDNDISDGKTAEEVLADFQAFMRLVDAGLPDARVLFLSIKPSLARWEHWPTMMEANRLIQDLAEEDPDLTYVDVATPLLNEAGEPADVFVPDGLHLNETGYRLWNEALAPYLD